MERGLPAPKMTFAPQERDELVRCARRSTTARLVAHRAKAILLAADGMNNAAIDDEVGVGRITVGRLRTRFIEKRLDALDHFGLVQRTRGGGS